MIQSLRLCVHDWGVPKGGNEELDIVPVVLWLGEPFPALIRSSSLGTGLPKWGLCARPWGSWVWGGWKMVGRYS